jgi:hypothetical protein
MIEKYFLFPFFGIFGFLDLDLWNGKKHTFNYWIILELFFLVALVSFLLLL